MLNYTELMLLDTFEDRLKYLSIDGVPAELTFGIARKLNQAFYQSREWKRVRTDVIARDLEFDLAVPGREIYGRILVHHMNPLTISDVGYMTDKALNPDFLITVSDATHRAIHFGAKVDNLQLVERRPGDTKWW